MNEALDEEKRGAAMRVWAGRRAAPVIGWRREGAVGLLEACWSRSILSRTIVQIPGSLWTASASRVRMLYERSSAMRSAVHAYIELQVAEDRQATACGRLHLVEQRLARWLLEAQRTGGNGALPVTHESLAAMLGVQRSTVSAKLSAFQGEGLIQQKRGVISILDRYSLNKRSCECQATIAQMRTVFAEERPGN